MCDRRILFDQPLHEIVTLLDHALSAAWHVGNGLVGS